MSDWQVRGLTRKDLDLLEFGKLRSTFRADRPRVVIHCAALTQTAICQSDPVRARAINIDVTALLAELCADILFIFFSTDLVFDGKAGNYGEAASVNPLNVYGETKAAAEEVVRANPKHLVIRTSLNAGPSPTGDRAFTEQLRLGWQRGEIPKLFVDEYRSPIAAAETAGAVLELILKGQTGLFHVAGRERLSRWEIGKLIASRWPRLNPKLEPVSLKDYRGAPRAPDTSLDCTKAQQFLSLPLPAFGEWLALHPEIAC